MLTDDMCSLPVVYRYPVKLAIRTVLYIELVCKHQLDVLEKEDLNRASNASKFYEDNTPTRAPRGTDRSPEYNDHFC